MAVPPVSPPPLFKTGLVPPGNQVALSSAYTDSNNEGHAKAVISGSIRRKFKV